MVVEEQFWVSPSEGAAEGPLERVLERVLEEIPVLNDVCMLPLGEYLRLL